MAVIWANRLGFDDNNNNNYYYYYDYYLGSEVITLKKIYRIKKKIKKKS